MFESIIGSTTADGVVYVKASLICVLASLIMGIIVAVTYVVSMRKKRTSEHFALALILVPAIVTAVILMVGSNVARAFSIAGVSKKNSLGRATGFEDKTQGTLFFDVCRILKAKRPKAFMLENVKNLCSHDRGRTLRSSNISLTISFHKNLHVYPIS